MFSLFKSKNKKNQKKQSVALTPDDNHIIASPKQIESLLGRMVERNEMVSLRIPKQNDFYNSAIVKMDREAGYIVLDEVVPKEGNNLLQAAGEFYFHARMDGVDTSFKGAIEDVIRRGDNVFYKTAFPESVRYIQRRESYRVSIPLAKTFLARLRPDEGISVTGELNDISVTGVSLRFSSLPYRFHQGDIVPDFTLQLDEDTLTVSIEIRHVREAGTGYLVGARFRDLDTRQERIIQLFVQKQERELRRKETLL